jgi:hypothetical protein
MSKVCPTRNLLTVYNEDGGKKCRGKIVPVRDVKAYGGSVDINPLIINLANKCV